MAHTLESVLDFFGDEVEQVGGALVARVGGKSVEVGRVDNSSGVFSLTVAGTDLVEAGKSGAKPKGKKGLAKEVTVEASPAPEPDEDAEIDLDIEA